MWILESPGNRASMYIQERVFNSSILTGVFRATMVTTKYKLSDWENILTFRN